METTSQTRSIVITSDIGSSPEKIFNALTRAEEIQQWFPSKAESSPVTGGRYSFGFEFSDPEMAKARNHERKGRFLDLIAGKKVSYDWMDRTLVTFDIEKTGQGCRVTLTHKGWEMKDDDNIREHTMGWTFFLQNLKDHLESGTDKRAQAMGLITY